MTSCATCGGRITPLRTSSTRYRHAPLLPKCPDHPPRPRPGLEDTLREAEPEEDR